MTAFEGILYCRGKQMENGSEEDFSFDRMINFLNMKSKMVAPADNPRIALQNPSGMQRNQEYFPSLNNTQ